MNDAPLVLIDTPPAPEQEHAYAALAGYVDPHSISAEQAVIAAMMLDAAAIDAVRDVLQPSSFYRPAHQCLCESMFAMRDREEPVDLVTLEAELIRRGQLNLCGGAVSLAMLLSAVPSAANVLYYAGIVARQFALKCLLRATFDIIESARAPDAEPLQVAQQIARAADTALAKLDNEESTFDDLLQADADRMEAASAGLLKPHLMSQVVPLDHVVGGLYAGRLYILAARPGVGKSSLAAAVASNIARKFRDTQDERWVYLETLEMSREEIVTRMLCTEARIDYSAAMSGKLNADDQLEYFRALYSSKGAQIRLNEGRGEDGIGMVSTLKRRHRKQPIGLLIVDYVQLMSNGNDRNRNQEIGKVSRDLKLLAQSCQCPVLLLSQLNRNMERERDKRPMLSDLRDSGELEQNADMVIALYNEGQYSNQERDADAEHEIEINILKNRFGPLMRTKIVFLPRYTRFLGFGGGKDGF